MEKNKKREEKPGQNNDRGKKVIQIICSLLVAIGIWLYVGEEKTVSVSMQVHDVPVEFSGEDTVLADKGLMLLSGYETTVDLVLKGPRMVLWKLDKDEIRVVADTAPVQDTGVQSLQYQVVFPNNIQRSQVQVASASIYAITVTVGELHTKEVPIYCDVIGSVADGHVTEEMVLDPAVLVLRGQRDDLLNVSYAKVNVDLTGASETVVQAVEFQLYDYNDIPVVNEDIRAAAKLIQVMVPVKMVKDIPLRINFVEATGSTMAQVSYEFDPETVRLKGDKESLDAISDLLLDTIYLQDLDDYQTLTYEIPVPEGTELVGDKDEVTVTIVVSGVSERRVPSANFTCINVPAGYVAKVTTESLNITVRGLSGEVSALSGENLIITADLSHVTEAGSFTVPVSVKVDGYSNVGIKGSYQIIVSVEPEPAPEPEPEPTPEPMPDPGVTDDPTQEPEGGTTDPGTTEPANR